MTNPPVEKITSTVPAWQQAFASDPANQIQINLAPQHKEQPLLDPDELDEFTQNSGLANPTAKLMLVGVGVLGVIFVLWFLVSGAFAPLKASKTETEPVDESPEAKLVAEENDPEIGQLKSELALARQEEQLAALREEKSNNTVKPPPPPATVKTVQTQPRPQPVRRAVPPPPPDPPRYRPAPPPRRVTRSAPPPVSRPAVVAQPIEQKNPQETWIAAAQLGSYGGSKPQLPSNADQATFSSNPQPQPQYQRFGNHRPIPSSLNRESSLPRSASVYGQSNAGYPLPPAHYPDSNYRYPTQFTGNTVTQSQPTTIAGQYSPVGNAEELPILLDGQQQQSLFQLPLGESFQARLADSLVWDGSVPEIRGMAELTQPILSREGEEIAPVGSMVFLKLSNPSAAGVVKLLAEAIVVRGSESDLEIPLPPNAVVVRATDGMPLMAERIERGGNNQANGVNWGGLLFDTARTAAEFGLGNSNDGFRDVYRFQRLENFYDRNFNQQRRNPYQQFQPQTSAVAWVLPAGKAVELYVNQRTTLHPSAGSTQPSDYR